MMPKNPPQDVGTVVAAAPSSSALNLVNTSNTTSIEGFRVFDIGQGDCIGLLDQHKRVFCYVDYGGVLDHPDANNPGNTQSWLTISYVGGNVSFILTHWDWDHYDSAYSKNTAAQSCEWVAPRQWVGPRGLQFASSLTNAKCWPSSLGTSAHRISIGSKYALEIQRCAVFNPNAPKQDRNTSGLAVALIEITNGTDTAQMILAGDCPFHRIQNPSAAPVRNIVAFHHGDGRHFVANTWKAISNTAAPVGMAFSFGSSNSFNHPQRGNYQAPWNQRAEETPTMRANNQRSDDFYW